MSKADNAAAAAAAAVGGGDSGDGGFVTVVVAAGVGVVDAVVVVIVVLADVAGSFQGEDYLQTLLIATSRWSCARTLWRVAPDPFGAQHIDRCRPTYTSMSTSIYRTKGRGDNRADNRTRERTRFFCPALDSSPFEDAR